MLKIVDPVLFFQIFFVGQDKKDTSNIAHRGLYNKQDLWKCFMHMRDWEASSFAQESIDKIKRK